MRFDTIDGTLYLTKADVAALTTFASNDTTRPHLSSVHVAPDLGRVSATDGHRLLVATASAKGNGRDYLVPAAELEEMVRLAKKDELAVSTVTDEKGTVVRISTGKITSSFAAPVGQFPPIEQILELRQKQGVVADRIGMNARYFHDLLLVQKAAEAEGVTLEAWCDELDPLWFEARGHDATWVGCIMPMRL